MRCVALVLTAVLAAGCGSMQRAGMPETAPRRGNASPRLFDASSVYRSMGALVGGGALPFIASVRYLAGPTPDSTLALFSMSLTNQTLTFQRRGAEFVAEYHVEASFRRDSTSLAAVRQIGSDEQVRVRNFQETLRTDESVIYQQFVMVPPGVYYVMAMVRDRNGPAYARAERADTAPRFAGPAMTEPIAVFTAEGRAERSAVPKLVANPRATLPYGPDSMRFYVERYGAKPGPIVARVVDDADHELWRDPVPLTPENEAIDDYFRRVQQANIRFEDEGGPGWLTERGEVFISLGEPDEMIDLSNGADRNGVRVLRWTYASERLVLYFQDQTGFSRFRLAPTSRAEYQRVLMRMRQARR